MQVSLSVGCLVRMSQLYKVLRVPFGRIGAVLLSIGISHSVDPVSVKVLYSELNLKMGIS